MFNPSLDQYMCGGFHAKFQDSRTNNKKSPQPFKSIGQIRENNSVCLEKEFFNETGQPLCPAISYGNTAPLIQHMMESC